MINRLLKIGILSVLVLFTCASWGIASEPIAVGVSILESIQQRTASEVRSMAISSVEYMHVVFSLLLATAVSFAISQVYKHTHQGLSFELAFMTTLVVLAPIVAVVMLFIRGDLVLSLGLIGSLSIIRFRTPIKDTRDMVFLFWVIATGLGCGTYNWSIVVIAAIIISGIFFLLHFVRYGQTHYKDFVLVVGGVAPFCSEMLNDLVAKYAKQMQVRSKETNGEHWEIIYEIRFGKLASGTTDRLIKEIEQVHEVQKVSLLAPQIALPV